MLRHGVLPLVISTIALSLFMQGRREGLLQLAGAAIPHAGRRRPTSTILVMRSSRPKASRCWRWRSSRSAALHIFLSKTRTRPADAGDRAEPDGGAHPRHPGRADDALHVPDQRRAGRDRVDPDQPDLPRQVHQRRDAGHSRRSSRRSSAASTRCAARSLGGMLLGVLDNFVAAYVSAQYRARDAAASS